MTVKKAAPPSAQLDDWRGGAEGSQVPVNPAPVDPPTRGDGDEKKSRRSSHRKT